MPGSTELQTIIGDVSAAIAGRKTFGRVELEQLRRQLHTADREFTREHGRTVVQREVIEGLILGIERDVANLAGLAGRARRMAGLDADQAAELVGADQAAEVLQ